MISFLTKTSTLWALFILFILETIGFGLIMQHWNFVIIDEISNPDQVRSHISQMSEVQRHVHAWMTATLDVVYPLTYGPLFAGIALTRFRPFFALPAVAVIPVDLAEGYVQVMGLLGNFEILAWKAVLTPTKLGLFLLAALIALVALARSATARLKRTR